MSHPTPRRHRADARPNVLIILADDMGYGDLSCYGNPLVQTARIDSIGEDGVRFTDGYSSAPLCSPSRAGLVTGRYQQRFGFEQQVSSGAFPERRPVRNPDGSLAAVQGEAEFLRRGIPQTERNIGELFRAAGYRTGVVGKWHLGHGPQFLPQNRGFETSDVFYGNTSLQATRQDDPEMVSLKVDVHDEYPDVAWTRQGLNQVRRNGEVVQVDDYLMFYFRDRALEFIDRHADEPFMLYVPMNSPVPPMQVPQRYYDQLRESIPVLSVRGYNAMLLAQDEVVGALLDRLAANGLAEDTIVVFTSDNGSATSRPGRNTPFSGGKFTTYEGGIRMPLLMRWPGHVRPGQVFSKAVSLLDLLPTVAAACGVSTATAQALDGVDLLPYLEGRQVGDPHEVLFWKLEHQAAVRMGRWKLYLDRQQGIARLFDLEADPGETRDRSADEPRIFAELLARYDSWNASLPPRAWTNIF